MGIRGKCFLFPVYTVLPFLKHEQESLNVLSNEFSIH